MRVGIKNPFERIISLLDRRKIFSKLVLQKSPIVLKLTDGSLASFRGLEVSKEGANLDGLANEKAFGGSKQRTVVVFFYSGRERYFLRTKVIKLASGLWRIMNSTEFFRLNRRDAYRVSVPESINLYLVVTSVDGVAVKTQLRITDFSATGVKVRWAGRGLPNKSSLIKARLIWLKGKEFAVYGQIKHRTKEGSLGIKFIELDSVQSGRFRILSIELQQLVNYTKH